MADAFMNIFNEHNDDARTVNEYYVQTRNLDTKKTIGAWSKKEKQRFTNRCKTDQFSIKRLFSLLRGDLICFDYKSDDNKNGKEVWTVVWDGNPRTRAIVHGDDFWKLDENDNTITIHCSLYDNNKDLVAAGLYVIIRAMCTNSDHVVNTLKISYSDISDDKVKWPDILSTALILTADDICPTIQIVLEDALEIPHFSYRYALRQMILNSSCDSLSSYAICQRMHNVKTILQLLVGL